MTSTQQRNTNRRRTRNVGLHSAALLLLTLGASCAQVTVRKIANDHGSNGIPVNADSSGIRFYRPALHVWITRSEPSEKINVETTTSKTVSHEGRLADGQEPDSATTVAVTKSLAPPSYTATFIVLPDFSEEYIVQWKGGTGSVNPSFKLDDGWNLTEFNSSSDSQTDELITAAATPVTSILSSALGSAESIRGWRGPGLYRMKPNADGSMSLGTLAIALETNNEGLEALTATGEIENSPFQEKLDDPKNYRIPVGELSRPKSDAERSICGSSVDWQDVRTFEGSRSEVELVRRTRKSVGALESAPSDSSKKYCTGTLIAPDLFLTASHCVDEQNTTNHFVAFNYELDAQNLPAEQSHVAVSAVLEDGVASGVDYAILRLASEVGKKLGTVEFERAPVSLGAPVGVLQHPGGRPKKVDFGVLTEVDQTTLRYADLDTEGGSSGSAVIDQNGRIVGVHTNGGCNSSGGSNRGVPATRIAEVSPTL